MRPCFGVFLFVGYFLLPTSGHTAAPPLLARPTVDLSGDPLPPGAIARLGTTRFRLSAQENSLFFSPDASTLVWRNPYNSNLVFLEARTGRTIRRCDGAGLAAQFTPDGKELVTDWREEIHFFNPMKNTRRKVSLDPSRLQSVGYLALSADGRLLASAHRETPGTAGKMKETFLAVFDLKTGRRLARMPTIHQGLVHLALSLDGTKLASWGMVSDRGDIERQRITRTVQIWNPETGKLLHDIQTRGEVSGVAFAPGGKSLVISTRHDTLEFWDVEKGHRRKVFFVARTPNTARADTLLFSPDGKTLLLGRNNCEGSPSLWDVESGRRLPVALPPKCLFVTAGFTSDGNILACGYRHETVIVWDVLSGKTFTDCSGHMASLISVTFRPDGQRMLTAGFDGKVLEWDRAGKRVRSLPSFPGKYEGNGFELEWALFAPGGGHLVRFMDDIWFRSTESSQDAFALGGSPSTLPAFSGRLSSPTRAGQKP